MTTTDAHQARSPEASTQVTSAAAGWAFPGPSSRYHTRERARILARSNSSDSLPAGPVLHTERRAHRRAQSSYAIPTTITESDRGRAAQRFFNIHSRRSYHVHSPPEYRSPLGRLSGFGSSRFTTMNEHDLFTTPCKSPSFLRKHSMLHDSPFSDYFTDDSRSIDGVSQSLPDAETQHLLLRLNKLQCALLQSKNDSQALQIVDRRMKEMEKDIDSLHSQSRQPPELDETGLFLEEDVDGSAPVEDTEVTIVADKLGNKMLNSRPIDTMVGRAELLSQLKDVLKPLIDVNNELQQRLSELRELNSQRSQDLEEKDTTIQVLQRKLDHMSADRELDRKALRDYQLQIIAFANRAKEMPGSVAMGLMQSLRSLATDWQQTWQGFEKRQDVFSSSNSSEPLGGGLAQSASSHNNDEQQQQQQVSDLRRGSSTHQQSIDTTAQGGSNTVKYIDLVEDVIRDKQSQPQHVDMSTQTETQPFDCLLSISNNLQAGHDVRGSDVACSDDDDSVRPRPVIVRPDDDEDDDNHSCAITTSPGSEVDPLDSSSRLSHFIGAMSDFVDDVSDDEADSVTERDATDPFLRSWPRESSNSPEAEGFWAQLMEIAGFIEH